ncbi:MAG: Crp/Fnr family transcriptional regulator [Burkholderiaceae bacterium]|nr:Crp/Fnr family transcriptional regulator [Burkholderiaceae bacterium]
MRPRLTDIKLTEFLSRLPLFSDLEPAELDRMADDTRVIYPAKGEVVFHQGDPCNGFHCIVYGRIKLAFTAANGAEKVVEIIGPGQSFGEALMFMDKPYIVTAQAVADSMLLHVSKPAVMAELERSPAFSRRMLAGLSRRLHGLIQDVNAYSLDNGTQRVIGYLLKEAQRDGEAVTLQASKSVVASRLNVTPEHFSRILHDLTEQGLVKVRGRVITIPDLARLRDYRK